MNLCITSKVAFDRAHAEGRIAQSCFGKERYHESNIDQALEREAIARYTGEPDSYLSYPPVPVGLGAVFPISAHTPFGRCRDPYWDTSGDAGSNRNACATGDAKGNGNACAISDANSNRNAYTSSDLGPFED